MFDTLFPVPWRLPVDPTQERPDMGSPHGRIAVLVGVVRQEVDVGLVPSMPGILFFRKPPGMLSGHNPGIPSKGELGALSDSSSGGFDDHPIAFFDPFL